MERKNDGTVLHSRWAISVFPIIFSSLLVRNLRVAALNLNINYRNIVYRKYNSGFLCHAMSLNLDYLMLTNWTFVDSMYRLIMEQPLFKLKVKFGGYLREKFYKNEVFLWETRVGSRCRLPLLQRPMWWDSAFLQLEVWWYHKGLVCVLDIYHQALHDTIYRLEVDEFEYKDLKDYFLFTSAKASTMPLARSMLESQHQTEKEFWSIVLSLQHTQKEFRVDDPRENWS